MSLKIEDAVLEVLKFGVTLGQQVTNPASLDQLMLVHLIRQLIFTLG